MPGDHARLSPSSGYIWMACAGMPALAAGLPEQESSIYAKRGTLAHSVLEQCLTNGFDAKDFVRAAARQTKDFETEDAEAVQIAIDWIRGEVEDGDETETEVKLRYSDDLWGTADFVRYRPATGELLVADYKHGSGVAVEAKNNPQGVIYALMKVKALGNRGISTVRFVIIQPRCFHEDGPVREFAIDGVDMLDWEDLIRDAVAATQQPGAPLASGDHCRWCKAAAICPVLKAKAADALQLDFAAVEPGAYQLADLAKARSMVDQVKAWAKAVDEFCYAEAERGVAIPGWKLVAKKAVRRVKDPDGVLGAADLLGVERGDLFTEPELKSPAQLEIALEPHLSGATKKARLAAAKLFLADHVEAVSSGHTLVSEDDPRPPIRGDVTDDFAAVE